MKRIYLASPYSHWCPLVRWWRWFQACRAAAKLIAQGWHVYSPIVNGHCLAVFGRLPKDWGFWKKVDSCEIITSDQVWVLRLKGWSKSKGVRAEIALARTLNLPVRFIRPGREYPDPVGLEALEKAA
jgi:hypothetical protein